MKLQQTTLDQTGVTILLMKDGEEKHLPLFSLKPIEEAQTLVKRYFNKSCECIKATYFSNNLMEVKIEDVISKYRESHLALPENYMEELVSGFPYIIGRETGDTKYLYA
jgi:hypothetical protein